MRNLSLCGLAVVTLLCGCQHDISGAYVAGDPNGIVCLQIVRTPDEHLTGQLSISKMATDGRVDFNSVAVSGVIGQGNITLSGSRFFGFQTFTLSGTFDGDKLTLSGPGGPEPLVLKRASITDYQAQISKLDARSQAILAEKAAAQQQEKIYQSQRKFVAQIDRLIDDMQRFDSEADVHLKRFPGVEKGYQAITAKVQGYVDQERRLSGNQNASVARSQLSIAATQASYETEQLHYQGQALESSLAVSTNELLADGRNYGQLCITLGSTPQTNSASQEEDAEKAACGRLRDSIALFRPKYNAIEGGLSHLEQVYTQEKDKQQALLRTAEKLE